MDSADLTALIRSLEGRTVAVIGDVVARSAPWRLADLTRMLLKNTVAA